MILSREWRMNVAGPIGGVIDPATLDLWRQAPS
jgi:hypothetical protein